MGYKWKRPLCQCMAKDSPLRTSRKTNLLFADCCLHHSRIWHGVNHRGFCFPADINNDTYNFLLVRLSHKHLSIREMANYLLNLALCLAWVKYWLPKLKGNLCQQTWTWASYFWGAIQIKRIGEYGCCVTARGQRTGQKKKGNRLFCRIRSKWLSLKPWVLEHDCNWWLEGEFCYKICELNWALQSVWFVLLKVLEMVGDLAGKRTGLVKQDLHGWKQLEGRSAIAFMLNLG